ncbi:MAG: hypothetical protein H7X95_08975, partial [Deltaproteobacteria bacterium]|nr:hypothetical protein [Deltaproteobacteria bacterium]
MARRCFLSLGGFVDFMDEGTTITPVRGWRYNEGILASSGTQSKGSLDPRASAGGVDAAGARPSLYLFGGAPDFFLLGPGFTLLVSGVLGALAA